MDQVEVNRVDRQRQRCLQIGTHGGEVGGQQQLEPRSGLSQSLVHVLEGLQDLDRDVLAEAGLVHLDPGGARLVQFRKQLGVDRHQAIKELQGRAAGGLA